MKYITYIVVTLIVAVTAAFLLYHGMVDQESHGYVLIGFEHWVLETSLHIFALLLLILFVIFYITFRLLGRMIHMPKTLKQKHGDLKSIQSEQALVSGLIDSAEGNWEKAEQSLIRHASNSGAPLIHYLTAAKAAQSRGAYHKRDEYLIKAHESTPGSTLAVGLTQAELHLSHSQFEQALESLTYLQSIAPGHATVLRLLHKTYEHLEDWEAIRKLIPSMHQNRVMMEAELKLSETEAYIGLLKQMTETKDSEALKSIWHTVPEHIKTVSGVHSVYFAGMIDAGAGQEVEPEVQAELEKEWQETLLVLYGMIESSDPTSQLAVGESWLGGHPNDAILLRMLGKLSRRAGLNEKAEHYFKASLAIEPSVDAYLFLGDLLDENSDESGSNEAYRKGLIFASSEVVKQVEFMPPEGVD